ncbi:MAG: DnaA ATPase domain-containing protein, partial [Thermodesulfobacteriota bacterium]
MSTRWGQIQNILENRIKQGTFRIWIKPLTGEIQDTVLQLIAPNAFVASWVRDRYLEIIQSAAAEVLGFTPEIKLEAGSAQSNAPAPSAPPRSSETPASTSTTKATPSSQEHLALPLQYDPAPQPQQWRYSFDEFIIGNSNQLAHAACTNLCRKTLPAESVFLASGPGLGKTHLLHAVGHYYSQCQGTSQVRVGYVTAEEFANQMIMALKNRNIDTFKDRYRKNLDVLLLEDVHFFQ